MAKKSRNRGKKKKPRSPTAGQEKKNDKLPVEAEQNGNPAQNGKPVQNGTVKHSTENGNVAAKVSPSEQPAALTVKQKREKYEKYRLYGIEHMKYGDFDKAIAFFETSLMHADEHPLPTDNHTRSQLIICRLHGSKRNHEDNLLRCAEECNQILENDPTQITFHAARCDALLRLLDYKQCASHLRKAVEADQAAYLDSVHLFFHQAAEATPPVTKKIHPFPYPSGLTKDALKRFFSELTAPSRQTCFSLSWKQIHESIDSKICSSLLPDNLDKDRVKKFLHLALDYNIKSRTRENEIFFLRQEIAFMIAQKLWLEFPLPPKPPPETKQLDRLLPPEAPLTYLMENGVYMARDGLEFVSSAMVEGITQLTQLLACTSSEKNPSLIVSLPYLTDIGFNLVSEIAETDFTNYSHLDEGSPLFTASDEDWEMFLSSRLRAHEVLEIKAQENLTPPRDASEDPKVFEKKLEAVVGTEKKDMLMKIELEASLPILNKYASLMSEISGIPVDILQKELTDDPQEETGYQPVGLSVLIQSTEFALKPGGDESSGYCREKVLEELKELEKDVVQFQIDYRKKVFEVAGFKDGPSLKSRNGVKRPRNIPPPQGPASGESEKPESPKDQKEIEEAKRQNLERVMQNLQFKGLELTKWLRGFVKYMMDRRDLEQELLDYSGCKTSGEAMKWFESMSNTLSAAESTVLRLIYRAMLWNLVQAYQQNTEDEGEQNSTEAVEATNEVDLPPLLILPGRKIEKTKKCLEQAIAVHKFITPAIKDFKEKKVGDPGNAGDSRPVPLVDQVQQWIDGYKTDPKNQDSIKSLKDLLGVKRLSIPYIEINVATRYIYHFVTNPTQKHLRHNSYAVRGLQRLSVLMDRTQLSQDTIFYIIASTLDGQVTLMPKGTSGLTTFPLCQGCGRLFGMMCCGRCRVTHYCSKECQVNHWKAHQSYCRLWSSFEMKSFKI